MPRKNRQEDRNQAFQEDQSEIQKKIERFSFDKFDIEKVSIESYINHFLRTCRVKGIDGIGVEDAKKDLLLTYIGPSALTDVETYFLPHNIDDFTFDEIVKGLKTLYKPTRTIFSSRLEFEKAFREDGESFLAYSNRLKSISKTCDYGQTWDERLRDRFAVGIRNPAFEVEVRQRWPDGKETNGLKTTFQSVLSLALTMERAQGEVNCSAKIGKDHNLMKVEPVSTKDRTFPIRCNACGGFSHSNGKLCPAKTAKCYKCNKIGHFARKCRIVKSHVKAIDAETEDQERNDETNESVDTVGVREINYVAPRATIDVMLNGSPCKMEFDSGARVSTIGKSLWERVRKSRKLFPNNNVVMGYGNNPLKVLGKTFIEVALGREKKILPALVMADEDVPLFGLPWSLAFGLKFPSEVSVHSMEKKQVASKNSLKEVQKIIQEFQELFREELGTARGASEKIFLKPNATPVVYNARRVPFPLRTQVEAELKRLEEEGIIERVDPANTPITWATPTVNVPKGEGNVRICGDFRVTLNKNIIEEWHEMPKFEDLTSKLVGGQHFTVLDLRDAYLQLVVDPKCRDLLTISTHMGYFRYKRIPFGLSISGAKFQRYMEKLLDGLNVGILLDDVILTGKNEEEHLTTLREVLKRMSEAGLRLKLKKCQFFQDSVTYLGHKIDAEGIHPTEDKVEAIKQSPSPKNATELRSFLGAINFYERFIPNLHEKCSDLHALTSSKVKWKWTQHEEKIFQNVKKLISHKDCLVPYDITKPVIVTCDASETGLGAVLSLDCGRGVEKPVAYASRKLSDTESRYASIDREALAIVYSMKKFRQYILGKRFVLRTDHKPLLRIFGEDRNLSKVTNNRLVRWALQLMEYDYEVEFADSNARCCADFLSRLPMSSCNPDEDAGNEESEITKEKIMVISNENKLKRLTTNDKTLQKVLSFMRGSWPTDEKKLDSPDLLPYWKCREDLSENENIVFKFDRVVVPDSMRQEVLELLHSGHPGITAMRALARYYVWWPKIDADIDVFVRRCHPCQQHRCNQQEVPLYPWNIPEKPWDRIHVDFEEVKKGVFWLVGVDAYSKWIEVEIMKTTTTSATITKLTQWFARFGVPKQIVTDNGPQFRSEEFDSFCKRNNIRHIKGAPYHPKTNGLVERFNRTLVSRYVSAKESGIQSDLALQQVLLSYRNTPHRTTGRSPALMFLGRRLPTLLDRLKPDVREKMEWEIWKQKSYHDLKTRPRYFEEGEEVWVKNERTEGWSPGLVERKTGELSYEVSVGGVSKKKHADHLRRREGALEVEHQPETPKGEM